MGAASPVTCTLLNPASLTTGAPLPNYPVAGTTGAVMRLTQSLCVSADGTNNPACCQTSPILNKATGVTSQALVCSHWSGAHISSQGCIQFGVLETEARPLSHWVSLCA